MKAHWHKLATTRLGDSDFSSYITIEWRLCALYFWVLSKRSAAQQSKLFFSSVHFPQFYNSVGTLMLSVDLSSLLDETIVFFIA